MQNMLPALFRGYEFIYRIAEKNHSDLIIILNSRE